MGVNYGVNYDFTLCFGFELDASVVEKNFEVKSVEKAAGSFHMEDRFDPKTGKKLAQVKVWDIEPKTKTEKWYIVDGERYEYSDMDPENWACLFEEKLGCHVEVSGSYCSGDLTYVFSLNRPATKDEYQDWGNVAVHDPKITLPELELLIPRAKELKAKLEAWGLKVGEPKIFISSSVG